jgi:hypothetical protein
LTPCAPGHLTVGKFLPLVGDELRDWAKILRKSPDNLRSNFCWNELRAPELVKGLDGA